jgi:hypothetical protein
MRDLVELLYGNVEDRRALEQRPIGFVNEIWGFISSSAEGACGSHRVALVSRDGGESSGGHVLGERGGSARWNLLIGVSFYWLGDCRTGGFFLVVEIVEI